MDHKKFDQLVKEEVANLSPSISANDAKGKFDLIQEISKEIEDTECHLADLKMRLRHAVEEYNAALAMALRKRVPDLSVSLNGGKCSAQYRSTCLSCKPDLSQNAWNFDPNPHGRRFSRKHSHLLPLSNQIEPLVDAIVDYFGNRYRTINVK